MSAVPTPRPEPKPIPPMPPGLVPQKPIREPDPTRLPDEVPLPNPDENDAPPQQAHESPASNIRDKVSSLTSGASGTPVAVHWSGTTDDKHCLVGNPEVASCFLRRIQRRRIFRLIVRWARFLVVKVERLVVPRPA